MNLMPPVRLGPFFWYFGVFLTLVLTFALVFLGIIPWETIQYLFLIAWGGGMLAILVSAKVGKTKEGPFSPLVFPAVVVGMVALLLETVIFEQMFGVSLAVGLIGGVLANFLSAMYEETFFLGIDSAAAAGGLPIFGRFLLLGVIFVPFHIFRYGLDLMMILILLSARLTLDALRIFTGHSDPSFMVHGGWNILVTIFGGI